MALLTIQIHDPHDITSPYALVTVDVGATLSGTWQRVPAKPHYFEVGHTSAGRVQFYVAFQELTFTESDGRGGWPNVMILRQFLHPAGPIRPGTTGPGGVYRSNASFERAIRWTVARSVASR